MRLFICVLLIALVASIIGCDNGPTKPKADIYPVAGTIKYKGKPLTDADVLFIPKGETLGFTGTGRTDKDGRYALLDMHRNNGMVPGEYRVIVSRRMMPDGTPVPADDPTPPIDSKASESLPAHISSPESSKVTIRVTKDKADYDLDLK